MAQNGNILDLFDNIEVNNVERISDSDKTFCETLQEDFNKVYAQIAAWRRHILDYEDPCSNPTVKVSRRASVSKDIPYNPNIRNGYDVLGFSPLYALKGCTDQLFKLCERFEDEIISHFNREYDCNFKSHHKLVCSVFGEDVECKYSEPQFTYDCMTLPFPKNDVPLPSYDTVIDYIIEDMGGKSFKQTAKDLAYESLKQNLWGEVTITKNRVKISGFICYDHWNNKFSYEMSRKLHKLFGTIKQHFDWPFDHTILGHDLYMTSGVVYDVLNSPCTSFRAYRNEALELTFKTTEQAQSFLELCESLKKKRS